jgi:cyanophycinase-like exopeptidase
MELVKIVSGMTGFYFGGGDQDQLKRVLSNHNKPSPVLSMIRQRWFDGMSCL